MGKSNKNPMTQEAENLGAGGAGNAAGEGGADKVRLELAARLTEAAAWLAAEPGRLVRARAIGLNRRWPRAHFHPTPELFIQTGGATRFEGPEQRWDLPAGDLGLIPRGVPHAETPLDRETPYGMTVVCHARAGFTLIRAHATTDATGEAEAGGRRITPTAVLSFASERGREAFRYLDEAEQAWAGSERGGAGEVAVDLVRVFLRVVAEETRRTALGRRRYSAVVEEARAVARSHLADPRLSVDWLAETAGCSADHLARRFRVETGSTVVAWLTGERVALAQRLLTEGKYQVAEVGWACGFAQPSYFIRVFRARTGLTPLAWRRARAG